MSHNKGRNLIVAPLARPFKSRGNCPHWHLTTFRNNPIVPYSASLRLTFEQKKIRVANV